MTAGGYLSLVGCYGLYDLQLLTKCDWTISEWLGRWYSQHIFHLNLARILESYLSNCQGNVSNCSRKYFYPLAFKLRYTSFCWLAVFKLTHSYIQKTHINNALKLSHRKSQASPSSKKLQNHRRAEMERDLHHLPEPHSTKECLLEQIDQGHVRFWISLQDGVSTTSLGNLSHCSIILTVSF